MKHTIFFLSFWRKKTARSLSYRIWTRAKDVSGLHMGFKKKLKYNKIYFFFDVQLVLWVLIHTYIHVATTIRIQNGLNPQNVLIPLLCSHTHAAPDSHSSLPITAVLSFTECRVNAVVGYLNFWDCLSLSVVHWRFIHVIESVVHSFSLLTSFPL